MHARPVRFLPAALVLVAALAVAPARAQDGTSGAPAMSGARGEISMWIQDAADKLGELSDATPEAKYSWRPGKGVRSTAEVYMHVAAANYFVPSFFGVAPPEGMKYEGFEESLTKKADVSKALKGSFAHLLAAFEGMSDADLEKPAELFGMKTTVRGAMIMLLSHAHEHLGQSIAYARMNGVTPPWTARQNAKMEAGKKAGSHSGDDHSGHGH